MNYKLNANENDDVNIIMRAGSDYVRTVFPKGKVIGIIGAAEKVEKSDMFKGFEICVNSGEYYINGKFETEHQEKDKRPDNKSKNPFYQKKKN